jgi:hypothetical protein
MLTYWAFGLGIHSELPLAGLVEAAAAPEVCVRWGDPAQFPTGFNGAVAHLHINRQEAIMALPEVATLAIRDGREIQVFAPPATDRHMLARHIVGNVLAILLFQRGYLVLHASTVRVDGRAVAFLGEPGAGKSSTAAALVRQGHGLLADDAAALQSCSPPALVVPGFPRLRLSPQVAQALGYAVEALVPAGPTDDKLILPADGAFEPEPAALERVYVLERGDPFQIEPLPASQAVVHFIRHSVPVRFLLPGDPAHLDHCLRLARWLPAFRLTIPAGLSHLPELARKIESHCRLAPATRDA